MHGVDELFQPCLERFPLLALFASNPKGKLGNDDGAGIALVLLRFEPRNHPRVTGLLCGLTQHVGIQQPAHSLRRFGCHHLSTNAHNQRAEISASAMRRTVPRGSGWLRLLSRTIVIRRSGQRIMTLRKPMVSPECHSVSPVMRQPKP